MSENRQRLKPWLKSKIHSGQIPGVEWVDEEAAVFKIPWKHGGKQDWNPQDGQLFKEWAKHTGRYREGQDKTEYATWKTRLRCAMNKAPDIKERKELHNQDSHQPYKVFQFVPRMAVCRPGASATITTPDQIPMDEDSMMGSAVPQTVDQFEQSTTSGDVEMSSLPSLPSLPNNVSDPLSSLPNDLKNLSSNQLLQDMGGQNLSLTNMPSMDKDISLTQIQTQPQQPHDQSQTNDMFQLHTTHIGATNQTIHNQSPQMQTFTLIEDLPANPNLQAFDPKYLKVVPAEGGGLKLQIHKDITLPVVTTELTSTFPVPPSSDALPPGASVVTLPVLPSTANARHDLHIGAPVVTLPSDVQLMALSSASVPQDYEMHVILQYKEEVAEDMYSCRPQGCRIFYGDADHVIRQIATVDVAQQAIGPEDKEPFSFPPPWNLLPLELKERSMVKKVLDSLDRGVLLECNHGDIYATRLCKCTIFYSNFTMGRNESKKLERHQKTQIFDYNNLFKPAIDQGSQLSAEVQLGFGQKWPFGSSSRGVLMSAKITAQIAEQYSVQQASVADSLSVQVTSPQISQPEEMDKLVEFYNQM